LRGLAKSTDDWTSPWGTVYKHIEGLANYSESVYGYQLAEHHAEMLEWMMECIRRRRNGFGLLPRGAAKTTHGNTGFLGWLIAMYPDLRVGLFSNTATQSADFSRAIRYTYESSTPFRDIFGDCVSRSKWTDQEWLHKNSRWHGSKDVTLFAQGVGGAIISKRFDIILLDDILDEENTETPEQREKVKNWFLKTLKPCLVPGGVIIGLGTRWAEGDLYEEFTTPGAEGGFGWSKYIKPALTQIGKTEQGEPVYASYWPDQYPVGEPGDDGYGLLKIWWENGTPFFMCSYQNDISGLMQGNVFLSANFQYFDKLPGEMTYTVRQGIDLASSEKQRADFTARATVAQDRQGNFYVMGVYRDKRETGHARFIVDGYEAFPETSLVRCESQAFQSTLIQEVMRDYPKIPIEGVKVDTDKVTRARAVAAKYEAHKVFHHRTLKDSDFELELLSFPKGHDDQIDALGLAMDLGGGGFHFGSVKR
jgi:predicted phage terminase large subunit-like protein